jgi:hypothetical protein
LQIYPVGRAACGEYLMQNVREREGALGRGKWGLGGGQ